MKPESPLTPRQIAEAIRNAAPFNRLNAADAARLAETARAETFKRGETLFDAGEGADGVWLIVRGKVDIHKYATGGKRLAVETLRAGDLCGILCRLAGRARAYPCAATAAEATTVLKIPDRAFYRAVDTCPPAMSALCVLCAARLRQSQDMRRVDAEPAAVRVAHLLLEHADAAGLVALTKREIAEHIGATQETAFRVLAELQRRGLIKSSGRRIRLLDAGELERMAAA